MLEPGSLLESIWQSFSGDAAWQTVADLSRLRELAEGVNTDPLTGVGNRRATERILRRKLDELSRY